MGLITSAHVADEGCVCVCEEGWREGEREVRGRRGIRIKHFMRSHVTRRRKVALERLP